MRRALIEVIRRLTRLPRDRASGTADGLDGMPCSGYRGRRGGELRGRRSVLRNEHQLAADVTALVELVRLRGPGEGSLHLDHELAALQ